MSEHAGGGGGEGPAHLASGESSLEEEKGKKEEEKEGDKNGNPLNASRVDSPALSCFLPSLSLAPHAIVSSMPSKVASN